MFLKRFRRLDQLEKPRGFSIRSLPEPNRLRTKSRAELFFIEGRELPERADSPLPQNAEDALPLAISTFCRSEFNRNKALHALNLSGSAIYVQ
jgi:hypothetical protein